MVLAYECLIAHFGVGKGTYPQDQLPLKCFEKLRIILAWTIAKCLQCRIQQLLQLTHEADSALKLRLWRIFDQSQVVRNRESVLNQQFSSLKVG